MSWLSTDRMAPCFSRYRLPATNGAATASPAPNIGLGDEDADRTAIPSELVQFIEHLKAIAGSGF